MAFCPRPLIIVAMSALSKTRDALSSPVLGTPESLAIMPRSRMIMVPSIISANSGFFCSAAAKPLSSSEITRHAVVATAVALRGESPIAAISPKISPALSAPIGLPLAASEISPSRRKYILSRWRNSRLAFSFSAKSTVPALSVSSRPADSKKARATAGI